MKTLLALLFLSFTTNSFACDMFAHESNGKVVVLISGDPQSCEFTEEQTLEQKYNFCKSQGHNADYLDKIEDSCKKIISDYQKLHPELEESQESEEETDYFWFIIGFIVIFLAFKFKKLDPNEEKD